MTAAAMEQGWLDWADETRTRIYEAGLQRGLTVDQVVTGWISPSELNQADCMDQLAEAFRVKAPALRLIDGAAQ